MKSISEIRNSFTLNPNELSSQMRYFMRQNIDWDVFLPTKGANLQRPLVWTLSQKRELINSLLLGRHIPHCAILNIVDPKDDSKDILQIIDGKQRLSTMIGFINNEFYIEVENSLYTFQDLPNDYQRAIDCYNFRYYIVNEEWGKPITDEQKIAWFSFINFAGTPQDEKHLNKLRK